MNIISIGPEKISAYTEERIEIASDVTLDNLYLKIRQTQLKIEDLIFISTFVTKKNDLVIHRSQGEPCKVTVKTLGEWCTYYRDLTTSEQAAMVCAIVNQDEINLEESRLWHISYGINERIHTVMQSMNDDFWNMHEAQNIAPNQPIVAKWQQYSKEDNFRIHQEYAEHHINLLYGDLSKHFPELQQAREEEMPIQFVKKTFGTFFQKKNI